MNRLDFSGCKRIPRGMQLALAVILVSHWMLVSFRPVNFEFAFVQAVKYFQSMNDVYIQQYFSCEANTVALPYLVYLITKTLPGLDILSAFRILNLLGVVVLFYAINNMCRILGLRYVGSIILLILFNPLSWAFAGRATADFFPASLGVLGVSFGLLYREKMWGLVLSGIVLGLASVMKYHAILLLIPLSVLYMREGRLDYVKSLSVVAVIPVVVVVAYAVIIYARFGFWFVPTHFHSMLNIGFSDLINNFILYVGFLVLLSVPMFFVSFSFRAVLERYWRHVLFVSLPLFALSSSLFRRTGEMDLGPLNRFLAPELQVVFFSILSVFAVLLVFGWDYSSSWWSDSKKMLGLSVFVMLLVLSYARPTQRYLLFVLPFFIMALPVALLRSKIAVYLSLAVFFGANGFIEYSRWCTGEASRKMVDKIVASSLIQVTDPGSIRPHALDAFIGLPADANRHYVVVDGYREHAVMHVSAGIKPLRKEYSLVAVLESIAD